MKYISTRNKNLKCKASEAIVGGIAKDGGLFVPESFPQLSNEDFQTLIEMSYPERSAFVLSKFLSDFTYEELLGYTESAYAKFYGDDPCPLVQIDDLSYVLELWHGPTCAFKDMALALLPYLMTASREKVGAKGKTLILVATSGDTGKAALEGFKNVENTDIIVFYPSEGVSDMQKLQMVTQEGGNVYVCGINGNFDDAQTAVKTIFADDEMTKFLEEKGYALSSANSINWGRLVPQIAYYISACCDLMSADELLDGEKVNFCVPTGNFGNILACYYAKQMGAPIDKLICASNENNILTDFFTSGKYDVKRDFYKTMSPSMDILISSNLERLLFEIFDRDDALLAEKMTELKERGSYNVDTKTLKIKASDFIAGFASEQETADTIDNFLDVNDYLLDPHTAVAMCVASNYALVSGDKAKTIVVSTASPYKFPIDVYEAISGDLIEDAFKATKKLHSFSGEEVPEPLCGLDKKQILYSEIVDGDKIIEVVRDYASKK